MYKWRKPEQKQLLAGKELGDKGDRRGLDAYINDQDYVPRKRKSVKPAMKWKVTVHKPKSSNSQRIQTEQTSLGDTNTSRRLGIYSNLAAIRRKELRRNPSYIRQLTLLFLGKLR